MKGKRKVKTQELTRAEIFRAALKVLDAEGVQAVTMRRLAEETAFSLGSLYNYYANKSEILAEIYADACRELLAGMQRIAGEEVDCKEAFLSMCAFLCEFRVVNSRRYREIAAEGNFSEESQELAAIRVYFKERLRALGLKGLANEEDVAFACRSLLALAEGWASLAQYKVTEELLDDYGALMRRAATAFLNGLEA